MSIPQSEKSQRAFDEVSGLGVGTSLQTPAGCGWTKQPSASPDPVGGARPARAQCASEVSVRRTSGPETRLEPETKALPR